MSNDTDKKKPLMEELLVSNGVGKTRPDSPLIEEVDAVRNERKLEGGEVATVGTWICNPAKKNRLFLDGEPLIAREIRYRYERIHWQAGRGHPWYAEPCPKNRKDEDDYNSAMLHHTILWEFGGSMFNTCDMADKHRGWKATDVFVLVNDEMGLYDDNRGEIEVDIIAYSDT